MKIILVIVTGSILATSTNYTIAAEKLELPKFKSAAEVVGWLKATGTCRVGADKETRCFLTIPLPREPDVTEARLQSLAAGALSVTISRKRRVTLSTKDSTAYVEVTNESQYTYLSSGKFSDVTVGFRILNSSGEPILDHLVPTDPFKHFYWMDDDRVLEQLGFTWRPRPRN